MNTEQLKKIVCDTIDQNRDKICEIGNSIYKNPELGFKEYFASSKVESVFQELGLEYEKDLAITGLKAKLNDKTNVNVAVLGELDAVVCPAHPDANTDTGAAHCCGHFAQIAGMLGCAIGLSAIKDELDGNVTFMATPAEECVELEYRQGMKDEGKIQYFGGKQEWLRLGHFDDVDVAMLIHGMDSNQEKSLKACSHGVGFIAKTVKFIGKEAHAGIYPWDGVNALDAATLALSAINAIRSTLKEKDVVKIHPIMTKGGTLVNIIPNDVRLEMYIRGATIEAIKDANFKVNRAIKGCAYAVGCEVEIQDNAGYFPIHSDFRLAEVFASNAKEICKDVDVIMPTHIEGISTDLGDVATMLPSIMAGIGGFVDGFHTKNFKIANEEEAYIVPAKILACTVIDLLANQGAKIQEIKAQFTSAYSMNDYEAIWKDILEFKDKGIA